MVRNIPDLPNRWTKVIESNIIFSHVSWPSDKDEGRTILFPTLDALFSPTATVK